MLAAPHFVIPYDCFDDLDEVGVSWRSGNAEFAPSCPPQPCPRPTILSLRFCYKVKWFDWPSHFSIFDNEEIETAIVEFHLSHFLAAHWIHATLIESQRPLESICGILRLRNTANTCKPTFYQVWPRPRLISRVALWLLLRYSSHVKLTAILKGCKLTSVLTGPEHSMLSNDPQVSLTGFASCPSLQQVFELTQTQIVFSSLVAAPTYPSIPKAKCHKHHLNQHLFKWDGWHRLP